jgi:hypothetical protein
MSKHRRKAPERKGERTELEEENYIGVPSEKIRFSHALISRFSE